MTVAVQPRAADLPTKRNINEQPWVIRHVELKETERDIHDLLDEIWETPKAADVAPAS